MPDLSVQVVFEIPKGLSKADKETIQKNLAAKVRELVKDEPNFSRVLRVG